MQIGVNSKIRIGMMDQIVIFHAQFLCLTLHCVYVRRAESLRKECALNTGKF
jgi:hypothetical protein